MITKFVVVIFFVSLVVPVEYYIVQVQTYNHIILENKKSRLKYEVM